MTAKPTSKPNDYTDLMIRLRAWVESGAYYPVEAEYGDGARFEGQLRLDRQALLALELNSQAYGQALFSALFAGEVRRAYDRATARAEALTSGRLRVRLWIDDEAVELHALPWERLYHPSRSYDVPLATSTPFSRYTSLETSEPAPVTERPIKLLAVISNPRNLLGGRAPVKVEVEVENLRQALGDLRKSNQMVVTLMPGRSGLTSELRGQLEAEGYQIVAGNTSLDNILRQLPGQHVFHFVGHGAFKRQGEHGPGQAALYLEKPDGTSWQVMDDEIVGRLAAVGNLPHLIFLVACESAVRDAKAEHPFVGLGPKLVQAGVPAVVAMQAEVPVEMARQLSGEFYRRLIEHGEVDQALSQARLVIFKPNLIDWAIPVLFMRLKQGKLFSAPSKEPKMSEESSKEPSKSLNISSERDVTIGDITFGNKVTNTVTNTGGTVVMGDQINTTTGADANQIANLVKQFIEIKRQVKALPNLDDDDKDELYETVVKIEGEVKKGDAANTGKLERWLRTVADMSDDILQVVVATLTNPAAGIGTAIRLIAERAKAEK